MSENSRSYELFKEQYLKFLEQNKDSETITKHLTEMNFLNKLEEIAKNNNFEKELEEIQHKKEVILKELEKNGIRPKK